MIIAVMAKAGVVQVTGTKYNKTNVGDGGFILEFADETVTSAAWKVKSFFHGPINSDAQNSKVKIDAISENWIQVDFDDGSRANALDRSEEAIGPQKPSYENDFTGTKWIRADDRALENTVIFRQVVATPPSGAPLPPDWPWGHIDASNKEDQ